MGQSQHSAAEPSSPVVIVQDAANRGWQRFTRPVKVVAAYHLDEVPEGLAAVEEAVEGRGLYAAGFVAYEAAPAFDRAFSVRPAIPSLPLLWFGLFEEPEVISLPLEAPAYRLGPWRPSVGRAGYRLAIEQIKEHIAAGHTYQVNYTLRLRAPFDGDPWGLFLDLVQAQECAYAAYLDIGPVAICSASPELFFRRDGEEVTMRPMKGTAARGLTPAADRSQAEWLRHSAKNRAENVMIVDMIRNDLGRVSRVGSVHVPHLFDVERYPTLWQMTSTVRARSLATLPELMAALFPCASITGAPKVRTMEIIARLEPEPRGVYCGCIGVVAPNRQARFSVAIRTAVVDRAAKQVAYGVGGGIVWDSTAGEEYEEWETKARVLTERRPRFQLLESLLWTPEDGFSLLDRHLARLADSAGYFGFKLDVAEVQRALRTAVLDLEPEAHKVRLLVDRRGHISITAEPGVDAGPVTVGLAAEPVSSDDVFLYHKTTHRQLYERARATRPECQEVILWNERGEVTEATTANLVVCLGGELLTPPLESGLLPGTMRAHLLETGRIQERKVRVDELADNEGLYLINSVRGWREARLVP
jgi:para-aminobenzoate synthetase / 4-amino-4-deoxychorismate lyase